MDDFDEARFFDDWITQTSDEWPVNSLSPKKQTALENQSLKNGLPTMRLDLLAGTWGMDVLFKFIDERMPIRDKTCDGSLIFPADLLQSLRKGFDGTDVQWEIFPCERKYAIWRSELKEFCRLRKIEGFYWRGYEGERIWIDASETEPDSLSVIESAPAGSVVDESDAALGANYRHRMQQMGSQRAAEAAEKSTWWGPYIDEGKKLVD